MQRILVKSDEFKNSSHLIYLSWNLIMLLLGSCARSAAIKETKLKITYSRKFAYKKAFNLKKLIVFHCWHFHLGNCCKSLISRVFFILLWVCNRPLAKLSKWSHFMLWPTASLINNPGYLRTGESVFVGKNDNTMCPLENRTRRSKQP